MLLCLSAYLDTEASQLQFMERKRKLEDELDRQLRVREKLDVQLSADKQSFSALRLGMSPCCSSFSCVTHTHTHTHTAVLRPFFQDHPGEPVPEENFWTLWCKED